MKWQCGFKMLSENVPVKTPRGCGWQCFAAWLQNPRLAWVLSRLFFILASKFSRYAWVLSRHPGGADFFASSLQNTRAMPGSCQDTRGVRIFLHPRFKTCAMPGSCQDTLGVFCSMASKFSLQPEIVLHRGFNTVLLYFVLVNLSKRCRLQKNTFAA